MQILSTLLIAASAASVLAAPATSAKKQTFSVTQKYNDKFQGKDGVKAILKAYRKYQWEHPLDAPTGANDGSIAANPEQYDIEYLCPVKIGGQTMNLDFDTGSSDLWVFSSLQPTNQTAGHTVFDPSKSSTFAYKQGYTWKIGYADGSGASGLVGTDTVNVGGTTVTSAAVEVATSASAQFLADPSNQGLLGLAFPSLNTISPIPQTPFFFKAMSSLSAPLFTATLKHGTAGSYDFGYIDSSKYTGSLHYTNVDSSSGFWQFTSAGYKINGVATSASATSIADTGTTLLLMNQATVDAYYKTVPGAINDDTQGGYTFPCSTTLPTFSVELGGGYYADIPGSLLNYAPISDGSSTCFGAVQSNGGNSFQIFGDIMFKTQFVVFNGKTKQLGFATQV
jgi:hypothetical protein